LKRFFDSSVLVPVFYADHSQHASSTKIFLASGKDDFCALRTLGEVYATLTGLHQSRALWLRTPRWRFQERVRSRSTSREMWITGCGNYNFWPDKSLIVPERTGKTVVAMDGFPAATATVHKLAHSEQPRGFRPGSAQDIQPVEGVKFL
jgi:hypothetical protein